MSNSLAISTLMRFLLASFSVMPKTLSVLVWKLSISYRFHEDDAYAFSFESTFDSVFTLMRFRRNARRLSRIHTQPGIFENGYFFARYIKISASTRSVFEWYLTIRTQPGIFENECCIHTQTRLNKLTFSSCQFF